MDYSRRRVRVVADFVVSCSWPTEAPINVERLSAGRCRSCADAVSSVFVPVYVILGHQDEHLGLMIAMEEMKLFDKGEVLSFCKQT